ncbi:MAG: hypothetical protein IPL84_17105 [Chitinophagaceae bacterium]|nr:hypothetical protein [Chitinophagaceae bacterium]
MSIKKVTIAGITGAVVSFLLGWLIYGLLLVEFMAEHTNAAFMRPEAEMIWWAMIASNLFWAILLAYIFNRWANITTVASGISAGAIICLLVGLAYSLGYYGMSTIYTDMTGLAIDIIAGTVMGAVVGGVIGFVLGKIKD